MTLEEATRALRDEGAMDPVRRRALRDRVLATPRKRPLRAIRWVMPIAAVLAAASVWASVARDRRVNARAPVAPVATAVAAPVAVTTTIAPVVIATETAAPPAPIVPSHAQATTTKPQVPDDGEHRALRAYREAERLQFDDKDYARALDAWDRYIPLAGRSPLIVDAKWQRALCLVRLGRTAEAREALEPFARGELGVYRRDEAQAISGTLQ